MDINFKIAQPIFADCLAVKLVQDFGVTTKPKIYFPKDAILGIPQVIWDLFVAGSKETLKTQPNRIYLCVRSHLLHHLPIKCQEEIYKNMEKIYGKNFLMDYMIQDRGIFGIPLYEDNERHIYGFSKSGIYQEMKDPKRSIMNRPFLLWSPVLIYSRDINPFCCQSPMRGWDKFMENLRVGDSFYEKFPEFLKEEYKGAFNSNEYELVTTKSISSMEEFEKVYNEYIQHKDVYDFITKIKMDRGYDIDSPRKKTDQNFDWLTLTIWLPGSYSISNIRKWFTEHRDVVHAIVRKRLRTIGKVYHFLKLDSITILAQSGIEYKFSYKEV